MHQLRITARSIPIALFLRWAVRRLPKRTAQKNNPAPTNDIRVSSPSDTRDLLSLARRTLGIIQQNKKTVWLHPCKQGPPLRSHEIVMP